MKLLYKVRWEQRKRFEGKYQLKERYAVGNSIKDALEFVNEFIPPNYDTQNFNAFTVGGERGEYHLYEVEYKDSCNINKKVLMPGRTNEEAIKYAMAYTYDDGCEDYVATEILEVVGFKITLK